MTLEERLKKEYAKGNAVEGGLVDLGAQGIQLGVKSIGAGGQMTNLVVKGNAVDCIDADDPKPMPRPPLKK